MRGMGGSRRVSTQQPVTRECSCALLSRCFRPRSQRPTQRTGGPMVSPSGRAGTHLRQQPPYLTVSCLGARQVDWYPSSECRDRLHRPFTNPAGGVKCFVTVSGLSKESLGEDNEFIRVAFRELHDHRRRWRMHGRLDEWRDRWQPAVPSILGNPMRLKWIGHRSLIFDRDGDHVRFHSQDGPV